MKRRDDGAQLAGGQEACRQEKRLVKCVTRRVMQHLSIPEGSKTLPNHQGTLWVGQRSRLPSRRLREPPKDAAARQMVPTLCVGAYLE